MPPLCREDCCWTQARITLSLLKRHGATNFQEVFEHLGLTVGAGFGALGEEGLYFGV
jgi:hypothetical protein